MDGIMTKLLINHISKVYGNSLVLNDVNFSINENEKIGLIGPNGSGKTTLLKIIVGLVNVDRGNIQFDDGKKYSIGFMPDNAIFSELGNLTANSFLKHIYKIINAKIKSETLIENLLKQFGLWEYRNQKIKTLSAGMKQKLNLIHLFVINPKFWLLDEPFSTLDSYSKNEFQKLLEEKALNENYGMILTSHAFLDLIHIVNKIVYIEKGKIKKVLDFQDVKNLFKFKKLIHFKKIHENFDIITWLNTKFKLDCSSSIELVPIEEDKYLILTKEILIFERFLSSLLHEKTVLIMSIEDKTNINLTDIEKGGKIN
jgi:ABC-type multidrug transport system ATPase subunit